MRFKVGDTLEISTRAGVFNCVIVYVVNTRYHFLDFDCSKIFSVDDDFEKSTQPGTKVSIRKLNNG